jgi:hypothetical protein
MENYREEHMGKMEIKETQISHEGSWKEGACCCNCQNLSILRKHPWNSSSFAKGPTTDSIGYVCTWGVEERIATFMDSMHGMCEMYCPTEEREKYLKIKRTSKKFNL